MTRTMRVMRNLSWRQLSSTVTINGIYSWRVYLFHQSVDRVTVVFCSLWQCLLREWFYIHLPIKTEYLIMLILKNISKQQVKILFLICYTMHRGTSVGIGLTVACTHMYPSMFRSQCNTKAYSLKYTQLLSKWVFHKKLQLRSAKLDGFVPRKKYILFQTCKYIRSLWKRIDCIFVKKGISIRDVYNIMHAKNKYLFYIWWIHSKYSWINNKYFLIYNYC